MIEADKMLHLSKYVTLLRAGTKSRVVRLHLHSSCKSANLPLHGGYVSRYIYHWLAQQAYLRTENYAAICSRTFATTVSQPSVDEIDHRLMSLCENIKKGQVSVDDLRKVIRLCDESDYQLHHSTGVLLLKCCGNLLPDLKATERQNLADQVWCLAKKNSEGLTLEYYNTLLDVHMENFSFVDPKKFLSDMNVEPDENTYRLLLNSTAQAGNSKHLQDIMSLIKKKNVALDEETFIALTQAYAANGNIADAEYVMTLMRDAKLSVVKAYTELACGYAKLGDIPNLVKILNEEPQSDANLLRIIKVLGTSDNGRHIPVVLNFLTAPAIKSEITKTLTELIRMDRAADAHIIINCFAMNDATKDVAKSFVNIFLNELVILNAPVDDITGYASDFVDSGCDPLALTNLAEIGLKLGRENLCFAIFRVMKDKNIEIRSHYYWPLLAMAHRNEGEAKIFSLIKSMVDTGVEIDSDTLINYIYPYVNTANASTVLRRLLKTNIPSSIVYTSLISFLLSRNRLQDIISLYTDSLHYKVYYKELVKPLVHAFIATKDVEKCVRILTIFPHGHYVALFLLLINRHSTLYIEDLQSVLEECKKCGLKISPRDAVLLQNNQLDENDFGIVRNVNVSKLINNLVDVNLKETALSNPNHAMYMNIKQLNCHLVELKSKKHHTINVLRRLLQAYCNENNLKKGEEMKREIDACQYEWTPGLKMSLFELYVKNNRLKEAETILSSLETTFLIDSFKLVMFATALIKMGRPEKAFDIIKKTKNISIKIDAKRHCYILLQTLAQSQYHVHTKDMLNLLLKKKYCNINTELLRPLVAISLERNNIPAAVNTLVTCAQQYNKAPLAVQLLSALFQQKGSPDLPNANTYIEKVYEIILAVNGPSVANTMLAIALATANKTQELQTILQKENLCMRTILLYFNYAQRNNEVSGLLTLLKTIPNTSDLDKSIICEMLLSIYTKEGNYNDALELWKLMYEEDIKSSEQFRHSFIQCLVSNKIPLPPELKQDKSEINFDSQ